MIQGVHHVNLLVRDLDAAMADYSRLFGVRFEPPEELPARGARLARFRAGDTWIVLVQPVADGEPMRHLQAHGEGLFLLSFEVGDLDAAITQVQGAGGHLTSAAPRHGLARWRVVDLDPRDVRGAPLQLCEDPDR